MSKQQLRYTFYYIDNCNMCGSRTRDHKILGKRLNQSQGKNPGNKVGITTTVAKCSNCGLVYSNPQPIPEDLQDHYGVLPESYWTREYFTVAENYFESEINRAKDLVAFKAGMKSLDIGAGLGKAMLAMDRAGFDCYGFEASEQFFNHAIAQMGVSSEKLRLGMIENVEYPENHFDFITFGAVLEHLYDPSESIMKALKWLKSHGVIHIEVPSSEWLINKLINLFYKINRTDYVGNISPMHEPYHLYEFGLKSFREHARLHGYEIAHYEYYICQTYMPKITDYILKPYMRWTDTGMQLCVWLRKK
jgi:2-polyprenyl-3-methyl-5-hydroxy-6-metoxy-1,4-benzoquinol methylase